MQSIIPNDYVHGVMRRGVAGAWLAAWLSGSATRPPTSDHPTILAQEYIMLDPSLPCS